MAMGIIGMQCMLMANGKACATQSNRSICCTSTMIINYDKNVVVINVPIK